MSRIETRTEELARLLSARFGPVKPLLLFIICNGCTRLVRAQSPQLLAILTRDWQVGEFGEEDFCPSCRAKRN